MVASAPEGVSWRVKRESVVLLGRRSRAAAAGRAPERRRGEAPFDDAELRWLWATRLETALLMYTRYVGPLKVADVEAVLPGAARFLAACGVPAATVPETFAEFMHWYDGRVEQCWR